MALTTTSTYDEYGNVLSSVTTDRDVKAVTKHYNYKKNSTDWTICINTSLF